MIRYDLLLIAATVSPLVTAFAAKLGERLGERVTITTPRPPWWRRRRRQSELQLATQVGRRQRSRHTFLRIEVGEELTDEARLALLDLDVTQPELKGHLLRWNEEAKAWLPVPDSPDAEDAD
ncbi:hypothetical protein [Streptomyces sp. NPDC058398]|uniref:hypothetical protein n=1 Tax=Streptomyces sp. NPDC058398 TaxID=3346479 RepID=UPI00365D6E87